MWGFCFVGDADFKNFGWLVTFLQMGAQIHKSKYSRASMSLIFWGFATYQHMKERYIPRRKNCPRSQLCAYRSINWKTKGRPQDSRRTPIEIIKSFGGKDKYQGAIKELKDQIYIVA